MFFKNWFFSEFEGKAKRLACTNPMQSYAHQILLCVKYYFSEHIDSVFTRGKSTVTVAMLAILCP